METRKSSAAAPRKRSAREDVLRAQDALQIVRPLQQEIGAWQAEIARLIIHAERLRERHEEDPTARQRVLALARTIRDVRSRLSKQLGQAPAGVRDHGRVVDVRRAIDSALDALDQAQHLLE